MNLQLYCERIRERLMPRPYTREVRADDAPALLIVRGSLLGRYAFAVFSWDNTRDGVIQLKEARQKVANRLKAFPIFAEVGLYIVFVGPKETWSKHVASTPADGTGLHRVIVQAVHFVDLESGAETLNQSAWGPIHFGGVDSVAPIVKLALY